MDRSYLLSLSFPSVKGIQPVEIQNHNCQNSPQLNYNAKHFHKFFCDMKLDNLIHKNHVSCAADGKPFRKALHDSKHQNL